MIVIKANNFTQYHLRHDYERHMVEVHVFTREPGSSLDRLIMPTDSDQPFVYERSCHWLTPLEAQLLSDALAQLARSANEYQARSEMGTEPERDRRTWTAEEIAQIARHEIAHDKFGT